MVNSVGSFGSIQIANEYRARVIFAIVDGLSQGIYTHISTMVLFKIKLIIISV